MRRVMVYERKVLGHPWTARSASVVASWQCMASDDVNIAALAVSGTSGMYSTDGGLNWSTSTINNRRWGCMAAGNGWHVALAEDGDHVDAVARSNDGGATWSYADLPGPDDNTLYTGLTYCGGSTFMGVRSAWGSLLEFVVSTDNGATWAKSDMPGLIPHNDLAYGAGVTVVCGGAPFAQFYRSTDNGGSWSSSISAGTNKTYNCITFDGKNFIAPSSDGYAVVSEDLGLTWTEYYLGSGTTGDCLGITSYSGTTVVVRQSSGSIRTSVTYDHGLTWANYNAPANTTWIRVVRAQGLFCAISQDGTDRVMTAP